MLACVKVYVCACACVSVCASYCVCSLLSSGCSSQICCSCSCPSLILVGSHATNTLRRSIQVRVAAVGGGTGVVLAQAGLTPEFVPNKALGKHMGHELPHIPGGWQALPCGSL